VGEEKDREREVNKLLGRARRRWKSNIKMERNEIGWEGLNKNNMAQDMDKIRAFVKTVIKFRIP
jgi:hypothetical protein